MLSDNELKRIKNNEETNCLTREQRDNNQIKVEAKTEQVKKDSQEKSAQFVKNVIFISIIALIVLGVSLIIPWF